MERQTMATKVNKKFLFITIASLLVLVGAVTALSIYSSLKSAERNITQGIAFVAEADAAHAAGDLDAEHLAREKAVDRFGRAVDKDGSRRDYLEYLLDALLKTTPKDEISYTDRYNGTYFAALGKLASLDLSDAELSLRFLEARNEWVTRQMNSAEAFESIISIADEKLEYLDRQLDDPRVTKIRGYRGIAQVSRMFRTAVPTGKREDALEDLKAAYAANPDFLDAGLNISKWHLAEREVHQVNGRDDLAEYEFEEAQKAILAFQNDHPDHIVAELLQLDFPMLSQAAQSARPDVIQLLMNQRAKAAAETFKKVQAMPAGEIEAYDIELLLARVGDEVDQADQVALVTREVAAHPSDSRWLLTLGQVLQRANQRDKALEVFQRVIDLPTPPLSLEGLLLPGYRRQAAAAQTTTWLIEYTLATTEEERESALQEAKKSRDTLGQRLGVRGQSQLKLIDARLALIDSNYAEATVLLSELQREVGANDEVTYLLATSLMAENALGDARQLFEQLVTSGYRHDLTLPRLADVYLRLGDAEQAVTMLERAVAVAPDNESLRKKLREVETFLIAAGNTDATIDAENLDPIVQKLMAIRQAEIDDDQEAVARLLNEAYAAFPTDKRIIRRMVQLKMIRDDREGALSIVQEALRQLPDDPEMMRYKISLGYDDPIKAQEALIDVADISDVEKALMYLSLYIGNQMDDKVEEWLDAAEEADSNHPSVVEARFVWSVQTGDMATARSTVQRAVQLNSDRAGGATFQGRLELAEGKASDAVRTFELATERLPYNSSLWRFLGQARLEAGLVNQAIDALARAMQSKPDDVMSAKLYARALARLGRNSDALAVIGRDSSIHRFITRDPELLALWLDLEAVAGDRHEALSVRRELLRATPDDKNNAIKLASLLIEDEEFDEAAIVLDSLENSDIHALVMTRLRALVALGRGSVDEGNAVFESYAATLTEHEPLAAARMAQAGFLLESGEGDRSVAVLEEARPYQGESHDIDRQLGNYFFNQGSILNNEAAQIATRGTPEDAEPIKAQSRSAYERAAAAYRSVIDTGAEEPGEDFGVSKRLVETLIRLDDFSGAQAALEYASTLNPDDLEILVLSAALAEQQGDTREALRVLGHAVELYPASHLPFFRRAILNRSNEAMFPDVIQDLNRVLELRPDIMDAWGMKFELYKSRGSIDEAFAELRKGIDSAGPAGQDTLRRVLVNQLLSNLRETEGVNAAIDASERYPDSVFWQGSTGDLCRRLKRFSEASQCFQRLYEMDETKADEVRHRLVAASLLDCMLQRDKPPTRGQTLRLLEKIRQTDETAPTVMLMARAQAFLGELDEADVLIAQAFELADGDTGMLGYWYAQTRLTLGTEAAVQKRLDIMAKQGPLPATLEIRRLGYLRLNKGSREEYVSQALELVEIADGDELATLEAYKLLSNIQYDIARDIELSDAPKARLLFEEAMDYARKGLAINEFDLELNNNAGYILAKHLDRGTDAVPFAVKAQKLAPTNSAVLDTVGVVFYEGGRIDDSIQTLQNAIRTAMNPDHKVLSNIHLAQSFVALEDSRSAHQALDRAAEAVPNVKIKAIRMQYEKEIDEVRATIQ